MDARNNPFRSERLDGLRYRAPEGWNTEEILARRGYRGLIVGPKGSGKTTLLAQVEEDQWRQGHFVAHVRLSRDPETLRAFSLQRWVCEQKKDAFWILDGAEQLSWMDRLRLRASLHLPARGFLLTAHHSMLGIPLLLRTETTPELLDELIHELYPDWAGPNAQELYARHKGNLRMALLEAYQILAEERA